MCIEVSNHPSTNLKSIGCCDQCRFFVGIFRDDVSEREWTVITRCRGDAGVIPESLAVEVLCGAGAVDSHGTAKVDFLGCI